MNNISIMFSHCINHRSNISEELKGIVGYKYFEHAVDLSKNELASAQLLLAQVELIAVRKHETHITESGKRFWSVDFMGVITYAGMFEVDAKHPINEEIMKAIEANYVSDFRAMSLYLRSDRFYKFRMSLYERAYENVSAFERTLNGKSKQEVKELSDANAIKRVERIKSRIRKLCSRTNALKQALGALEIETLMLTRLIQEGFFNLESFSSTAAA
ncbi:MAG: hypothetical protein ACTS9Y_00140 [Methylophilus sp.]|uniref:hypothetical protein n=1 Tax=Methylophilus sp. TaxID=29541 RepID=UPI003FA0071E